MREIQHQVTEANVQAIHDYYHVDEARAAALEQAGADPDHVPGIWESISN